MKHITCYSMAFAALILANVGLAAAAPAKAPPLPRGSEKVKLHPGQNPLEMKRDKHAHKRPKKDKSLDDTRATITTTTASTK